MSWWSLCMSRPLNPHDAMVTSHDQHSHFQPSSPCTYTTIASTLPCLWQICLYHESIRDGLEMLTLVKVKPFNHIHSYFRFRLVHLFAFIVFLFIDFFIHCSSFWFGWIYYTVTNTCIPFYSFQRQMHAVSMFSMHSVNTQAPEVL